MDDAIRVASLVRQYQEHHPFPERSEHFDETHDVPITPAYYKDVLLYSRKLCLWVRTQAESLGIRLTIYQVTVHDRIEGWGATFALAVDGLQVLRGVSRSECMEYALLRIEQTDLYADEGVRSPLTGAGVRKEHNLLEAKRSRETGYKPRYSHGPGPFTEKKAGDEAP